MNDDATVLLIGFVILAATFAVTITTILDSHEKEIEKIKTEFVQKQDDKRALDDLRTKQENLIIKRDIFKVEIDDRIVERDLLKKLINETMDDNALREKLDEKRNELDDLRKDYKKVRAELYEILDQINKVRKLN